MPLATKSHHVNQGTAQHTSHSCPINTTLAANTTCVSLRSRPTGAAGFIVLRLFIGFSLAAFVCCQFWCTSMFNTKIVGSANAIAAGWGNMGGGVTHFLMPLLWQGISKSQPGFIAWRWAFFVPAAAHIILGSSILLFAQVRKGS
jgi:NNP family nitrate/nitrite transporter-like MFS transporter